MGPIRRSGRWPAYDKPQKVVPVADALARAWDLRRKIIHRVQAVPVSTNLEKIWQATLEDCSEGSCMGPWFTEEEISRSWAAMTGSRPKGSKLYKRTRSGVAIARLPI